MFNESITDVVFYYTSLKGAYKILNTGKLNLTPTMRNSSEEGIDGGKFYFMSLTRSRYGEYHKNSNTGVLFELDGKKLSQRFSGKAADYWDTMKNDMGMPMKDEMEDRLLTDKDSINIIPYIKHMAVLYDKKFNDRYVLGLYTFAKKNNIAVNIYDDTKSWLRNNKNNSLSHDEIKKLSSEIPKSYDRRMSFQSDVVSVMELYHKKSTKELSKPAKKLKEKMRYFNEFLRSVSTDIHNESGSIADGSSESVRKLMSTVQKSEYKNVKEFLEGLRSKWEEIDRREEKTEFLQRNRDLIREFIAILKGKDTIDLSVFNNDEDSVGPRIRNLLFGMLRNDVLPDEKLLGWEINDIMSGYRLEQNINNIVTYILDRVGIHSS